MQNLKHHTLITYWAYLTLHIPLELDFFKERNKKCNFECHTTDFDHDMSGQSESTQTDIPPHLKIFLNGANWVGIPLLVNPILLVIQ